MKIYDDEQDKIIPRPPQGKKSLQDEIRDDLHENEAKTNPTLKHSSPPPDPRDPRFLPMLEEKVQRVVGGGLMKSNVNACTQHLEILRAVFPDAPLVDYPRLTVQLWFAIKDWKWSRLKEAGISGATSLSDVARFDTATLGDTYAAVTRIQTAVTKFINVNRTNVPDDPKFAAAEEFRVRIF